MGFFSSLLAVFGFGIGIPLGLVIGYFIFHYFESDDVKDPDIRPLHELDAAALQNLKPEIPFWVKMPDYERVDWLNHFVSDMWPYLDKGICAQIKTTVEPYFEEYVGQYQIQAIEFENLTLGTLPPTVHGFKFYETNEKELVMEPAIRWAGNPNIIVAIKLWSVRIRVQLVDLQIFAAPRVTLKPLVPAFPCFASVLVSLMEKPHVDFGLKVMGLDLMSIPLLYRFVQETIKKQVANLYLWPEFLEIPILDPSTGAAKKPVGILHVKVVRAIKLLKMDLLGTSDPYVKLNLSGERLPSKKTTIKKKNLNPEWNEKFKLAVKDPEAQILHVNVYDWDKVGTHDRLGSQLVPLKQLTPHETREFTLDLLKNSDINDHLNKKSRGKIVLELTYAPFKSDGDGITGGLEEFLRKESIMYKKSNENPDQAGGGGLLTVILNGAEDVEGERHNNPYVVILFKGEKKKSKIIKKTRDPLWDEEFQFVLEEPPINEKIHIEVMSKKNNFGFRSKESLGHVDIKLADVVYNGHINEKYHLIDSKNGVIHVGLHWKTT